MEDIPNMYILNLDDVFTNVMTPGQHDLGRFAPIDSAVKNIGTIIYGGRQKYTIQTHIAFKSQFTEDDPFGFKMYAYELTEEGYRIINARSDQLIARKGNQVYIMSRLAADDSTDCIVVETSGILRTDTKKDEISMTFNQFQAEIEEYTAFTGGYIEILLGDEEEAPVIVLGSQAHTEVPEQKQNAPQSEKNKTEIDINELEQRLTIRTPGVTFDDIAGLSEQKEIMMEIYGNIVDPEFAMMSGINPREQTGYLITGPSGCGKTLLVKALVSKLEEELGAENVLFYNVPYSVVTSTYRGGEAKGTDAVFELVKSKNITAQKEGRNMCTVLFFDELQLWGQRTHGDVKNEALDTFLARSDGVEEIPGLVMIGASYLEDVLDPALVGRLKNKVTVDLPKGGQIIDILNIHIDRSKRLAAENGNETLFADLDYNRIQKAMKGFSGRKISGVIRGSVGKVNARAREIKKTNGRDAAVDYLRSYPVTTDIILEMAKVYRGINEDNVRAEFGLVTDEMLERIATK